MSDAGLVVIVGAAIAVGIVGTVVPVLPGLWLIWVACLFYGIIAGFGSAGGVAMLLITLLAVGGTLAGIVLPNRSAGASGVSRLGRLLALVLAIVGFFVIPVIGAPLGFAVGILAAALVQTRDLTAAWTSTRATIGAMLAASGVQLGAGVVMGVIWVAWVVL